MTGVEFGVSLFIELVEGVRATFCVSIAKEIDKLCTFLLQEVDLFLSILISILVEAI